MVRCEAIREKAQAGILLAGRQRQTGLEPGIGGNIESNEHARWSLNRFFETKPKKGIDIGCTYQYYSVRRCYQVSVNMV